MYNFYETYEWIIGVNWRTHFKFHWKIIKCWLCNSLQRLNISSTPKANEIISLCNKIFNTVNLPVDTKIIATQMNMRANLTNFTILIRYKNWIFVQMFFFLFVRRWEWLSSTKTIIITMKLKLPFLLLIKTMQTIYLINPKAMGKPRSFLLFIISRVI